MEIFKFNAFLLIEILLLFKKGIFLNKKLLNFWDLKGCNLAKD